jgi:hypothetical protein
MDDELQVMHDDCGRNDAVAKRLWWIGISLDFQALCLLVIAVL